MVIVNNYDELKKLKKLDEKPVAERGTDLNYSPLVTLGLVSEDSDDNTGIYVYRLTDDGKKTLYSNHTQKIMRLENHLGIYVMSISIIYMIIMDIITFALTSFLVGCLMSYVYLNVAFFVLPPPLTHYFKKYYYKKYHVILDFKP